MAMHFSLVIATIGRTRELERLLVSLTLQTHRDFEVIVVDQNPPGMLDELLTPFRSQLALVHIHAPPGLSRARNRGLRQARGEVVVFPDDDCWYEPNTLHEWRQAYAALPQVAGIMARAVGPNGEPIHGLTHPHPGPITRENVWRRTNGNTLSFRRATFVILLGFDESLGPGAGTPWAACEDAELPIRAIDANLSLYYQPKIVVRHPNSDFDSFPPPTARRRALAYGRGMGRVLRQRKFALPTVAAVLIRPLGGSLLCLLQGRWNRACCYGLSLCGRLQGWLSRPRESSS